MTAVLPNQTGGVDKATVGLHLAAEGSRKGKRATVSDADPRGSTRRWLAQYARAGVPRVFAVVGPVRATLYRAAPEFAGTAQLTIGVTSTRCGRNKIAALPHGQMVADMLCNLPAREFPAHAGAPS